MISRENFDSYGREHPITSVPPVVVALPRVDAPLAVDGVPEHAHHTGVGVEEIGEPVVDERTLFPIRLFGDEACIEGLLERCLEAAGEDLTLTVECLEETLRVVLGGDLRQRRGGADVHD